MTIIQSIKRIIGTLLVTVLLLYCIPVIDEGLTVDTAVLRSAERYIRTVTVMGHTMAYREYGEGPPVVLIHGITHSGLAWEKNINALIRNGYRVLVPDLFGHGLSDKPANLDYSYDLFAQQIAGFMKASDINGAHIVGHSLGGAVAIRLACTHPLLVKRLILIGTTCLPERQGVAAAFTVTTLPLFGDLLSVFLFKPVVRFIFSKIALNDGMPVTDAYMDEYWKYIRTKGFHRAYKKTILSRKFNPIVFAPCLQKITSPTLIMHGDRDRIADITQAVEGRRMIKKAGMIVIGNGPHSVMETDPDIINGHILAFLSE